MTPAAAGALLGGMLVLAAVVGSAAAAVPVIHHPPPNLAVSGGGQLHVVGELPAEAGGPAMSVWLNGTAVESGVARSRPAGGAVLHATVQLVPGPNTLDIQLLAGGRVVLAVQRKVAFLFTLGPHRDVPAGFARQPFHGATGPAACTGCHEIDARSDDAGPAGPEASTCHSCHAGLTRKAEVHGPAAQWVCTRCHDPASTPARHATPDPVMPLCFGCHLEQKERFYGSRYQHGPTTTGQCTICHNPHGSDHGFFLKKAAWDVCTTCHFEKADGRHVISWGPRGQTHPTRGRPNPTNPGRELSCAGCHNPHAAPGPKLWNFGAVRYVDLCRNCHRNVFGG